MARYEVQLRRTFTGVAWRDEVATVEVEAASEDEAREKAKTEVKEEDWDESDASEEMNGLEPVEVRHVALITEEA